MATDGADVRLIWQLASEKETLTYFTNLDIDEGGISRLPISYSVLAGKKVAIVGCGSAASKIAVSLARSGTKEFVLVDDDDLAAQQPGVLIEVNSSGATRGSLGPVEAWAAFRVSAIIGLCRNVGSGLEDTMFDRIYQMQECGVGRRKARCASTLGRSTTRPLGIALDAGSLDGKEKRL